MLRNRPPQAAEITVPRVWPGTQKVSTVTVIVIVPLLPLSLRGESLLAVMQRTGHVDSYHSVFALGQALF